MSFVNSVDCFPFLSFVFVKSFSNWILKCLKVMFISVLTLTCLLAIFFLFNFNSLKSAVLKCATQIK